MPTSDRESACATNGPAFAAETDDSHAPRSSRLQPLLLSGLDSLYVSYYLDLAKGIDFEELSYSKERLKAARHQQLAEIQLGSERFALMPFGKQPYTYVLCNEAFEIRLGERMSPSCHVQFTSQFLWQCGLDDLVHRFDSWCASLKLAKKMPEVVARADWAFDYQVQAIDFTADDFVSRFRKDSVYRASGAVQTFTLGRGNFVLRVYDKVAEIQEQSQKFWFFDLWGRRDGVWRIEFQVRRERLHEGGIETIDDLRSFQSDVLWQLANNHTTLRRANGDSNRARWPLHPLWNSVIDDICALPRSGLIRNIDPKGNLTMRIYHQGRALYGNLKGYAALLSEQDELTVPLTLAELIGRLNVTLKPHHSGRLWKDTVTKRMTALRLGQW